jgi:protein-disulfide isomerase
VIVGGALAAWRVTSRRAPTIVPADSPAAPTPVAAADIAADPRMADRALGDPKAPVSVAEWFSLTCPHCAAFHRDTLPDVRKNLIDTGKVRLVFHDFPLDQVALTAAMVARSLPPERYEPFVAALFASQDRWAFARGVNSTEELAKMAALAGMPREKFNAVIADQSLKSAILQVQDQGEKFYHIDSTPSFIFNGPNAKDRRVSGEQTFESFAKLVAEAAGQAG